MRMMRAMPLVTQRPQRQRGASVDRHPGEGTAMLEQAVEQLTTIGFVSDREEHYVFRETGGYEIGVTIDIDDWRKSKIDYGPDVVVHHRATTNFVQPESIVVLQCVCRLLGKGYPAASIELEKTWPLGHREKGRLDILLRA